MTKNQCWLLTAARNAADYMNRTPGTLPKGMYDDIFIGRELRAAIAAVEADEARMAEQRDQLSTRLESLLAERETTEHGV